jgi:hypothetical protein
MASGNRVTLDKEELPSISIEETSHYPIKRGTLEHPSRYWNHLLKSQLFIVLSEWSPIGRSPCRN